MRAFPFGPTDVDCQSRNGVAQTTQESAFRNIGQPEVGFPAGDCTITGEMAAVAMDLSDDREASEGG